MLRFISEESQFKGGHPDVAIGGVFDVRVKETEECPESADGEYARVIVEAIGGNTDVHPEVLAPFYKRNVAEELAGICEMRRADG